MSSSSVHGEEQPVLVASLVAHCRGGFLDTGELHKAMAWLGFAISPEVHHAAATGDFWDFMVTQWDFIGISWEFMGFYGGD